MNRWILLLVLSFTVTNLYCSFMSGIAIERQAMEIIRGVQDLKHDVARVEEALNNYPEPDNQESKEHVCYMGEFEITGYSAD